MPASSGAVAAQAIPPAAWPAGLTLLQLHGPATPGWLAKMTGLSSGAVIVEPDLERFDRDIQRHAPAPPPAALEFLRGYPAGQLRAVGRFAADLAAAFAPA